MHHQATWAGCIFLFALATQAMAADQPSGFAKGLGISTCGHFAHLYSLNPEATEVAYFDWAEGYMTALNGTASEGPLSFWRNLGALPVPDQKAHIRKYCDAHPLAYYAMGVLDLWGSLPMHKN